MVYLYVRGGGVSVSGAAAVHRPWFRRRRVGVALSLPRRIDSGFVVVSRLPGLPRSGRRSGLRVGIRVPPTGCILVSALWSRGSVPVPHVVGGVGLRSPAAPVPRGCVGLLSSAYATLSVCASCAPRLNPLCSVARLKNSAENHRWGLHRSRWRPRSAALAPPPG